MSHHSGRGDVSRNIHARLSRIESDQSITGDRDVINNQSCQSKCLTCGQTDCHVGISDNKFSAVHDFKAIGSPC